jgi:hypothetical protein
MTRDVHVSEVRTWSVLDAMSAVVNAWEEVHPSVVVTNCFKNAEFGSEFATAN